MADTEYSVEDRGIEPIRMRTQGVGAEQEAENLRAVLRASGVAVESSSDKAEQRAPLGTPEIILTIFVTSAMKALIATALPPLEEYLRQRVRQQKRALNLQVVVRGGTHAPAQRILFSLGQATQEAVLAFSENLRKAIDKL